jgi:hypothetical protein
MEKHPQTSAEGLKKIVSQILDELGLRYGTEVNSPIGSSIIGKGRRVDIVVYDDQDKPLMHIECKSQNSSGTTEDKLFKAVAEANRDKANGIPSIIVFSGFGWNQPDVRHALLNGSVRVELLKEWLATYFYYRKTDPDSIHELKDREGLYKYFE